MNQELLNSKCQKIKAFLFDIDGVLSDGKIMYDNNLVEYKNFNIKDGWAIVQLKKLGYITGIITGRTSAIVSHRAHELKVDFLVQGKLEKLAHYEEFKIKFGLNDEQIAYIGDDLIDLPLLVRCGLSGAPNDSVSEVRERVDFVSFQNGGNGAAREFIELVLKSQNVWASVVDAYTK